MSSLEPMRCVCVCVVRACVRAWCAWCVRVW
jgi:hypothetical protein